VTAVLPYDSTVTAVFVMHAEQ